MAEQKPIEDRISHWRAQDPECTIELLTDAEKELRRLRRLPGEVEMQEKREREFVANILTTVRNLIEFGPYFGTPSTDVVIAIDAFLKHLEETGAK